MKNILVLCVVLCMLIAANGKPAQQGLGQGLQADIAGSLRSARSEGLAERPGGSRRPTGRKRKRSAELRVEERSSSGASISSSQELYDMAQQGLGQGLQAETAGLLKSATLKRITAGRERSAGRSVEARSNSMQTMSSSQELYDMDLEALLKLIQ